MKKLKLKALEFNGSEVLTRGQLKNVMGGDGSGNGGNGCCAHNSNNSVRECGLTQSQAQSTADTLAQQSGGHWYWCCSSC